MKLHRLLSQLLSAGLLTAACFAVHAQTTLRFGHANNPGEVAHDLYQEFAENVTKKIGRATDHSRFPLGAIGQRG